MLFMIGCTTVIENAQNTEQPAAIDTASSTWMDITLKDVNTNTEFKISDFRGKPVLLESFAVWCPTCTRQQKEIKKLHDELGDSVISVSIDTDPNEDEQKVIDHASRNGFNWRYAVSPVELTRSLIDDFGTTVVNAPQVPVILVCEDGNSHFLKNGVKDPNFLKQEIAQRCSA